MSYYNCYNWNYNYNWVDYNYYLFDCYGNWIISSHMGFLNSYLGYCTEFQILVLNFWHSYCSLHSHFDFQHFQPHLSIFDAINMNFVNVTLINYVFAVCMNTFISVESYNYFMIIFCHMHMIFVIVILDLYW